MEHSVKDPALEAHLPPRQSVSSGSELDIPNLFRRYDAYKMKGNYEFYTQEFAYSVIYGNLKQENLPRILDLLYLDALPRVLFLIQVEDCRDIYQTFPEFRVFPLKGNVVIQIRKALEELGVKGVVSNYLGRDTIGAFLCVDGPSLADSATRERLRHIANTIIRRVVESTQENICIGISGLCDSLGRFQQAYAECQETLTGNFYRSSNTCAFHDEEEHEHRESPLEKSDLDLYTSWVIGHINAMDDAACEQTVREMMCFFAESEPTPLAVRLYAVEFINMLSSYYIDLGLEKKKIERMTLECMKSALNSNYLASLGQTVYAFCQELCIALAATHQSPEAKIRTFVDECFRKFYSSSEFNLTRAAELCNYSTYHFSRLFKRIYDESFTQYLASYRVERAKELLLQSGLTVEDIAWRVGFSSTGYFCTVFKNVTGQQPRQFKNNCAEAVK